MKAIDSLDNPRVIFKNKNSKDYIVLTKIYEQKKNEVRALAPHQVLLMIE